VTRSPCGRVVVEGAEMADAIEVIIDPDRLRLAVLPDWTCRRT
jgi:hypothetical protein